MGWSAAGYENIGPNRAALYDLKSSDRAFKVEVTGVDVASMGDLLTFQVRSEEAGRLWVLQVDPEDNLSVIFPNKYTGENHIAPGENIHIPPKGADWVIEAWEPVGQSILAFIVTQGEADLDEVFGQQKNMAGDMDKALNIVTASPNWGLEKMVVDVKRKDSK
jgi:hypothetical protein